MAGRIEIGLLCYGIQGYAERLTRSFSAAYPEIEISIRSFQPSHMMEALTARDIDVAYVFDYAIPRNPGILIHSFRSDKLVALIGEGNPLAARDAVSIEDLTGEKIVFTSNTPSKDGFLDSLLQTAGLVDYERIYADHVDTLPLVVRKEAAVAIVDEGITSVNWRGVVAVPISTPGFKAPMSLAYLESNDNEAIALFVHTLTEKKRRTPGKQGSRRAG